MFNVRMIVSAGFIVMLTLDFAPHCCGKGREELKVRDHDYPCSHFWQREGSHSLCCHHRINTRFSPAQLQFGEGLQEQ